MPAKGPRGAKLTQKWLTVVGIGEDGLDAVLNVVEALLTDHRVRKLGEVAHLGDRRRCSVRLAGAQND